MTMRQKFETYGVPVLILVAAVFFITMGVMKIVKVNTFPKTTAVITRIEYQPSADPESADTYDVYVKYTVQGTTYESKLDDYKNSYREGKELTVYYNPEKPGEVLSPGVVGPIVSIALGAVALFVGGGAVLRLLREKAAKKAED